MSELSENVAKEIMIRIVRQEFGPDQPFPHEMDLCTEYNVSRVVIREAKKHLQALGMVYSRKKVGSFIMPHLNWNYFNRDLFDICMHHSPQAARSMEDYFTFRQQIEPTLVAQVAQTHSPEFVGRVQKMLCEMTEALNMGSIERWLIADLDFHIEMYIESRNILALPLANLMRPLFLRGFAGGHTAWSDNLDKHRDLAHAVFDHDPEQARHYAHIIVHRGYMDYMRYVAVPPARESPTHLKDIDVPA